MAGGYFVVQWWMVKELNLKGNELLVFAIIYGFSQDGECEFTGSLKYLSAFTNSNISTVQRSLNSLVEKDFIAKFETFKNGVKYCSYKVKNAHSMCKMPIPPVQNSLEGMCKMHNNNIQDNINNNIESVCMYGIAQNVKLTPSQYEKLKADYSPDVVDDFIEQLSLAKAGKGYKNKNDYYTIISWITHDRKSGKGGMPF